MFFLEMSQKREFKGKNIPGKLRKFNTVVGESIYSSQSSNFFILSLLYNKFDYNVLASYNTEYVDKTFEEMKGMY